MYRTNSVDGGAHTPVEWPVRLDILWVQRPVIPNTAIRSNHVLHGYPGCTHTPHCGHKPSPKRYGPKGPAPRGFRTSLFGSPLERGGAIAPGCVRPICDDYQDRGGYPQPPAARRNNTPCLRTIRSSWVGLDLVVSSRVWTGWAKIGCTKVQPYSNRLHYYQSDPCT